MSELNCEKRKLRLLQLESEDYLNLYIESAPLQRLVTNSLFVTTCSNRSSLAGVGHREVSDNLCPSTCTRTGNYARSTAANSLQCQLPSCNSHEGCPSLTSWYQQSSPGSLWLSALCDCTLTPAAARQTLSRTTSGTYRVFWQRLAAQLCKEKQIETHHLEGFRRKKAGKKHGAT